MTSRDVVPDPIADLDLWWQQLRAAAVIGTARRAAPPFPPLGVDTRADANREVHLLDAAALGDAVRRAGRVAATAPEPDPPALPEAAPFADPRAVQVLELLLIQGPVAAGPRRDLTRHWLDTAARAGHIVPARLLPTLLDAGSKHDDGLRASIRPVIGERGRWLARLNPTWSWAVDDAPVELDPRIVTDRTEGVAQARRVDRVAAREGVLSTWETDAARARSSALAGLLVGLGPDDEPFLEACLDDRAKGVREQAAALLDRLPGSRRATRMAHRLTALLSVRGMLRKELHVELPDDPDQAAERDGLVDPGSGVSRRGRWLEQLVCGAPLSVWTDAVGGDPAKVVSTLRGDIRTTVLPALRTAALQRHDVEWARALLATAWDPGLVTVLPAVEREAMMVERVGSQKLDEVAQELVWLPRPWGPDLSEAVLLSLGREKDSGHAVRVLRELLPEALDPSTTASVERVMNGAGDNTYLRTTMRDVLQHLSLHRSISEAFQ